VILRDPALTARLLKLANSVIYGQARKVMTVNQAIVLLGFRAVKSLALSTSVYDVFSSHADFTEDQLRVFWRHCLETATYAQLLASRIQYPVQEEAFVAGLLHDIGLVILCNVFGKDYQRILKPPLRHAGFIETEDQRLGINHADAAAFLFADWGLPDILVDAIRHHHVIGENEDLAKAEKLSMLIGLADRMGKHPLEPSPATDGRIVEEKHRLAKQLNLKSEDLKNVDTWVAANLSTIAGYLEMDIGSPMDVLRDANEKLFELYLEVEGLLLHRRDAIRREVDNEKSRVAAEVLRVISATFSHYINNATTTIMGHAQLIEMAMQKGQINDPDGRLCTAMRTVQNSVINITAVLDELKAMPVYRVIDYHERSKILDVEESIRRRIEDLRGHIQAKRPRTSVS
jgi:putative nucleotidyltransferase with HDIG domain